MAKLEKEPYVVTWRTGRTKGSNKATFSTFKEREKFIEKTLRKNAYVVKDSIVTYTE